MRHFLPYFGLVSLLALTLAVQQCGKAPIKTSKFVPMETPYIGCNDSLPTYMTKSKIGCSVLCQKTPNCVAFSYNKAADQCRVCIMNGKGKLFNTSTASNITFYAMTQGVKKIGPTTVTPLNMTIDIGCGINVGTMILLRANMTDWNGFRLILRQDDKNMPLYFNVMLGYGGTTGPPVHFQLLTISTMVNGNMVSGQSSIPNPFPILEKKDFELRILAREDNYAFYVNGTFLTSYKYALHPENTQSIQITDNLDLFELSL